MAWNLNRIDRRRFLRGGGVALALPVFGSLPGTTARGADTRPNPKRLGCFYFPDGVPMPLPEDPAYDDWAWFPHGGGQEFRFTKCMEPLEPIKDELTVLSGFSHPKSRSIHGHHNGHRRRRQRVRELDLVGSGLRPARRRPDTFRIAGDVHRRRHRNRAGHPHHLL